MGKDRVQWMPEPFPLQKIQQRLHRTELPSYLSSHRAIGMWVLDFDVTRLCSCRATVPGCRSKRRRSRAHLPYKCYFSLGVQKTNEHTVPQISVPKHGST